MSLDNPYAAPLEHVEPLQTHSRLLGYLDAAGIICAGMPLLCLAGLFIAVLFTSSEQPTATMAVGLVLSFFVSSLLWLVGGVYNCVRVCQGRKLALLGIVLNIASFAVWAGIIRLALIH